MSVIIGVDPHKASHTAVAIDDGEDQLASVRVRASRRQVDQLLSWAVAFLKADLGDRVRRRHGLPSVPAARVPR